MYITIIIIIILKKKSYSQYVRQILNRVHLARTFKRGQKFELYWSQTGL